MHIKSRKEIVVSVVVSVVILLIGAAGSGWQGRSLLAATVQRSLQQAQGEFEIYVVQPGDTLAAIALQYRVTVEQLLQINNIGDANLIYVGQQLRIPIAPSATATATLRPSPTLTATLTLLVGTRATKAPTATATATYTPPPPAAPGDALWTAPAEQIELFSPVTGAIYHSPIEVIGYSQTFEGIVVIRLTDAAGNILGTRKAQGGAGDGFAFFQTYLRFEVGQPTAATLEVFAVSAKDGAEINRVQIPIILRPGQRVIDLDLPKIGSRVCAPIQVSGYSQTFEANVNVEVMQRDGVILLASGNATGGTLGSFAEFASELNLEDKAEQPLLIGAYETDAQDGGEVDHTRIPVSLVSVRRTGANQPICP